LGFWEESASTSSAFKSQEASASSAYEAERAEYERGATLLVEW
jgi:hypothetical protein